MGFCKDCKFWKSHETWASPDGFGDCEVPNAMWSAHDDASNDIGLDTLPDFGCVQFEARE